MKFFIDAGHGGSETGAVGHGLVEKDLNLIVSLEVKRVLESYGVQVCMSRLTDSAISLVERCTLANLSKADYFISIHHNANNGKVEGSELYHSVNYGVGRQLATLIQAEFMALSRNVKVLARESETVPNTDYYHVIKYTAMPAVITEYAYVDSPDFASIDTNTELMSEALAIARGCLKMVGIMPHGALPAAHWAQEPYEFLKSKGLTIHETRFDDNITRGEVFALLKQLYEHVR